MITRQTLLILGAGASEPFGFPTGFGLLEKVCSSLTQTYGVTPLLEFGFEKEDIEEFRKALLKSGASSVDAFLEDRDKFIHLGKAAMAAILLDCEKEKNLFGETTRKYSWYQYFFNKLGPSFEEFDQNQVAIITYNYDRSLEHYLITVLSNRYGKEINECAKKLEKIPIIHLHGKLGELPSERLDFTGLKYGYKVNAESLSKCIQGIEIIHESGEDKPQFQIAHKLINAAERICFLGFGYDQTNLERLNLFGFNGTKSMMGSAYGFTPKECAHIKKRFGGWIELDCEHQVLAYLRHNTPLD